jgi:hypothetical protein
MGIAILGVGLSAALAAAETGGVVGRPLLSAPVDPREFGTQDHTITVVSGPEFEGGCSFIDSSTLSLQSCLCVECVTLVHYYANLDLPAGAIIDFIGVNAATTHDGVLGFTLLSQNAAGSPSELAAFTLPAHGFQTDYAGPLGPGNAGRTLVLNIEHQPTGDLDDIESVGYVEIWWRRAVSEPPPTPTFADVPNGHPFYQFVEALGRSGITGGCGGGNFCPDAPLTRGQMAVFLSKALGLHWPN